MATGVPRNGADDDGAATDGNGEGRTTPEADAHAVATRAAVSSATTAMNLVNGLTVVQEVYRSSGARAPPERGGGHTGSGHTRNLSKLLTRLALG